MACLTPSTTATSGSADVHAAAATAATGVVKQTVQSAVQVPPQRQAVAPSVELPPALPPATPCERVIDDDENDDDDDDDAPPRQTGQQQTVRLVRDKQGQWTLAPDGQLVNNLSWVVGFMELANAGDFAANVWNEIPVPTYAIVLMAIGGAVAGTMSFFAFRDAGRACCNVRYLRRQRSLLLEEKRGRQSSSSSSSAAATTLDLDVILAINFRELGTELVSRYIMDLLMGFGAVLICIGTYLAIGGATPGVYMASNLLSGYVGNTPIALFGLVNFTWAAFIFCKAQSHITRSRALLGSRTATVLVKRRARQVQVFSVINGAATVLGGAASMITATRWWGYIVLIPVIVSSIFCNVWWRKMIGYSRSEGHPRIECRELCHALELAAAAAAKPTLWDEEAEAAPQQWCLERPHTLEDTLSLLISHSLFHPFCLAVVANPDLSQDLLAANATDVNDLTLTASDICALPAIWHPTLMNMASTVMKKVGPDHFRNRERYLAELLGTYCTVAREERCEDESDDGGHSSPTELTEKL